MLAVRKPGVVDLKLRPEISRDVILKSSVVSHWHAEAIEAAIWESSANGTLKIEVSPTFPEGKGWRELSMSLAIAHRAGWDREAHKSGENVVTFFLVRRKQPVFNQSGPIAEVIAAALGSSFSPRKLVCLIIRDPQNDFDVIPR